MHFARCIVKSVILLHIIDLVDSASCCWKFGCVVYWCSAGRWNCTHVAMSSPWSSANLQNSGSKIQIVFPLQFLCISRYRSSWLSLKVVFQVKVIIFFLLIFFSCPCILTMLCLIIAAHQHDLSRFVLSDSLHLITICIYIHSTCLKYLCTLIHS